MERNIQIDLLITHTTRKVLLRMEGTILINAVTPISEYTGNFFSVFLLQADI